MILDLTEQLTSAQIAFGIALIAGALVVIAAKLWQKDSSNKPQHPKR